MMTTPATSFDDLRDRINESYDTLSPHLQRIARYALQSPNRFALHTVQEVSTETDVQPSSIVRFAQTFGFRGFTELQRIFRHRLIEGTPDLREEAFQQDEKLEGIVESDPLYLFNDFAKASIDAIDGLRQSIGNEDLKTAIQLMDSAETIYVVGQRRAFPVAAYLAYGLARMGRKSAFLDFVGGMAPQQAATITERDLLIAVSFAEYTRTVVDIVKDVSIRGCKIVAITDTSRSPLSKRATVAFHVGDDSTRRYRPLAPSLLLAQVLVLGLSYIEKK